ncbi:MULTISPECIES: hypothetical protein [unclassified Nitratireductor]|uniref:hypothetical protein n=1 Tax=unclassified Nitratireductor TaxID=2641084 RepID=UPI0025DA00AA|nr:hypothetical protein [Nitratireductor sp.]
MSLTKLFSCLLRVALLLSPAAAAVIMFVYLLDVAERTGEPQAVDPFRTATIR